MVSITCKWYTDRGDIRENTKKLGVFLGSSIHDHNRGTCLLPSFQIYWIHWTESSESTIYGVDPTWVRETEESVRVLGVMIYYDVAILGNLSDIQSGEHRLLLWLRVWVQCIDHSPSQTWVWVQRPRVESREQCYGTSVVNVVWFNVL